MIGRSATAAITAVVLACGAGSAAAQGCAPGGPFSGPYVGATVGGAWGDAAQHPLNEPKVSGDAGGVALGGLIGWGLQCNKLVAGVEADIHWADIDVHTRQSGVPFPATFHSSMDWFGTVRGRLGVVVAEGMLLYATAGVLYTDLTHSVSGPTPFGWFQQSDSDLVTAFTVGGGIELLRHDRWLLRVEALWADLGRDGRTYTFTGGCGAVCTTRVDWDDDFWTVRLGLSVKLGGHTEPPPPLK